MSNILAEKGYLQRIAEALENESSGGGDSGGGSSDFFIVNIVETYDEALDDYTYSLDKTNAEIYEASTNGKICFLNDDGVLVPLNGAEENFAEFIGKKINGNFPMYALADNTYTLENNVLTIDYSNYSVSLRFNIDCDLSGNVLTTNVAYPAEYICNFVSDGHSVIFRWYSGTVYYSAKAVACQARGTTTDRAICAIMTGGKILNFTESGGRFTATIPTN